MELLVALALAALVLSLGTALLVEFLKAANAHVGRSPGVGGPVDVALDALEQDLRHAARVLPAGAEARGERAVLRAVLSSGERVRWFVRRGTLVRESAWGGDPSSRTARQVATRVGTADVEVFSPLARVALRVEGSPLRLRAVLLRNEGRVPLPEEP